MRKTIRKIEVDYYEEIAKYLAEFFQANLNNRKFVVKVLIAEISAALRTLIANGYNAGPLLMEYSRGVHRLHLDISVVIENTENNKFEIIVFEIKKTKKLGLSELSQLIGYCLVSKSEFGILLNVDNSVSQEFSIILDADKDLTTICRLVNDKVIEHKFGVMVWNSQTKNIEYTESGSIKTLIQLLEYIEESLK